MQYWYFIARHGAGHQSTTDAFFSTIDNDKKEAEEFVEQYMRETQRLIQLLENPTTSNRRNQTIY